MRLFAAIALPPETQQGLVRLQAGLKGARWVSPENLHLTLRFLGEVDPAQAPELDAALQDVRAPAFDLQLTGLGTFGRPPASVWAGVEADPKDALAHLQANLESALMRAGFGVDARKFSPHVTLARLKGVSRSRLIEYLELNGGLKFPPFRVDRFVLFESHLSHEGAHYAPLADYPL